jgi:hypothetical protein
VSEAVVGLPALFGRGFEQAQADATKLQAAAAAAAGPGAAAHVTLQQPLPGLPQEYWADKQMFNQAFLLLSR